jgi:hypothetical protein
MMVMKVGGDWGGLIISRRGWKVSRRMGNDTCSTTMSKYHRPAFEALPLPAVVFEQIVISSLDRQVLLYLSSSIQRIGIPLTRSSKSQISSQSLRSLHHHISPTLWFLPARCSSIGPSYSTLSLLCPLLSPAPPCILDRIH